MTTDVDRFAVYRKDRPGAVEFAILRGASVTIRGSQGLDVDLAGTISLNIDGECRFKMKTGEELQVWQVAKIPGSVRLRYSAPPCESVCSVISAASAGRYSPASANGGALDRRSPQKVNAIATVTTWMIATSPTVAGHPPLTQKRPGKAAPRLPPM